MESAILDLKSSLDFTINLSTTKSKSIGMSFSSSFIAITL